MTVIKTARRMPFPLLYLFYFKQSLLTSEKLLTSDISHMLVSFRQEEILVENTVLSLRIDDGAMNNFAVKNYGFLFPRIYHAGYAAMALALKCTQQQDPTQKENRRKIVIFGSKEDLGQL